MKCISAAANAASVEDFGKVKVEVLGKTHYNRECPAGHSLFITKPKRGNISEKRNHKSIRIDILLCCGSPYVWIFCESGQCETHDGDAGGVISGDLSFS